MRTNTWADRSVAEQVTLGDLLVLYGTEVTPGKKGRATEHLRIKLLQRHPIARRIVATLTPNDLNKNIPGRLGEGRAGSTVNRELNLLHHLFVIARKRWSVNISNPCDDIERPRNPRARDHRFQEKEEKKLFLIMYKAQ